LDLTGKAKPGKTYSQTILSSTEKYAYNTLSNPMKISPRNNGGSVSGGKIATSLAPMSVNVFRVGYEGL